MCVILREIMTVVSKPMKLDLRFLYGSMTHLRKCVQLLGNHKSCFKTDENTGCVEEKFDRDFSRETCGENAKHASEQ